MESHSRVYFTSFKSMHRDKRASWLATCDWSFAAAAINSDGIVKEPSKMGRITPAVKLETRLLYSSRGLGLSLSLESELIS